MTPIEQQEHEEFWAAVRPFAARIADYEAQATDGMTPRQADEVLEESFVLAMRNRKSFNPRKESVAEWMYRIFRKTRAYLRTVRPEVDAHKTRCTCFGKGHFGASSVPDRLIGYTGAVALKAEENRHIRLCRGRLLKMVVATQRCSFGDCERSADYVVTNGMFTGGGGIHQAAGVPPVVPVKALRIGRADDYT